MSINLETDNNKHCQFMYLDINLMNTVLNRYNCDLLTPWVHIGKGKTSINQVIYSCIYSKDKKKVKKNCRNFLVSDDHVRIFSVSSSF